MKLQKEMHATLKKVKNSTSKNKNPKLIHKKRVYVKIEDILIHIVSYRI